MSSNSTHYLVTVRGPWSEAPTVLGIFTSPDDANAAIARAQQDGPMPDRYSVEGWRDDKRVTP
ncbi:MULTISPECIES: hypothetical protein [unclassified Rathayibacter]|uniref:hypothetical protein n=1 Tax=unclassified Rathayibacter TaxID=2609250 RepID=UPI000CE775D9|nr:MULTISPECIES: hypothetical protein [unclassified Rathayibacter]PPF32281.1 hypothetical protein C5B93_15925 [Rathayibacter sp. AY1A2]PPI27938.1 hypothetical protein C5D66_15070 [Rathayibacter sp. AY1B4]